MLSAFDSPTDRAPISPRLAMLFFMLSTLLAPVLILNKLLFALLMLWTLLLIVQQSKPRLRTHTPAYVVIAIFLYGLLISQITHSDSALAMQFFFASLVLLLIHFVDHFRIDMDSSAELCGKTMVVATILYWTLALNQDLPYATQIFEWMNQISLSAFASRDYIEGAATLTFALGAAPFLFVPWCLVTVRLIRTPQMADAIWFALYGLAIVLSGARGLAVVALVFLIAALISMTALCTRILVTLALMAILTIILPAVLTDTMLFSSEESSNAIKAGHFNSFLDQLDVWGFLFGNGLGSLYFSSGRNEWLAHTELTPIDFARYVGVPLAILFYSLLLFPSPRLCSYCKEKGLFCFGFLLFLVLSVTNPTLVNSYGMLCVVWYWTKIRNHDRTDIFATVKQPIRSADSTQSKVEK